MEHGCVDLGAERYTTREAFYQDAMDRATLGMMPALSVSIAAQLPCRGAPTYLSTKLHVQAG